MFEEAGMFAALYTDSSAYSLAGRVACKLVDAGAVLPKLVALASRKPTGIPQQKVFSHDVFFPRLFGCLSEKHIREGLQGADVVYSMCGEDPTFLRWAKGLGLKLVVDVFVHPGTERFIEEESLRFLGKSRRREAWIEAVENHFRNSFSLADIILCPSHWVAEGVMEYAPQYTDKIRVVPYGSSLVIRDSINQNPEPGRILFAGREALRKGLHYLADAVQMLRQRGLQIDARVAGVSRNDAQWIKNAGELNFLGNLPLNMMHHEFEQADVFVLPSLSEGQAGVVLEAMACGCPVIATRECGVDFMPGCGISVPSRDPQALANAIGDVVGNRPYRKRLADGALKQSAAYSMEAWKDRLVKVVTETV
jgi:glycosyltransferase involved in cell wall biosynthesis